MTPPSSSTARTASGTIARHGRLRVASAGGTLARGLAGGLAVVLASALVFGVIVWFNLQSGVQTFDLVKKDNPQAGQDANAFEGGVNILLVGSDSRQGQGAEFGEGTEEAEGVLNDVNMLFHLSEDHTHATVVSIPRDTLIDTPECVNDQGETQYEQYGVMMNSILGSGGVNCVVATVESMSGVNIDYAAMVQFKGVIEMSNAVGGVDVCVSEPISDPYVGLELDSGMHNLRGADALKFLRTRHGVGDGSDLARIGNQQVFLSALFRKVKSDDTFTNPGRLYAIARAATQNMTLSSNLNNIDTLVSLATALADVPPSQMAFVRLPVAESSSSPGRVEPLEPDADELWRMIRDDEPVLTTATPSTPPPASSNAPDTAAPSEDAPANEGGDVQVPENDGTEQGPGMDTPSPKPSLEGQTADKETCSNADNFFG